MLIKVCGMRDTDNIREVVALGVDMIGFIFYPKSPRYVKMISSKAGLIPDYSEEQLNGCEADSSSNTTAGNKRPLRVGVFVDDMPQNIVTRVFNYNLDYVQLHGSESRVMIENLRRTIDPDIHKGIKIIKAISVTTPDDILKYKEYEDVVDMFLFDTKCDTIGGSGTQFDWSVLDFYDGEKPFLLSGGIGMEDVLRIKSIRNPRFEGIDVNSRFEISPAVKDIEKLKVFIDTIRKYDNHE